MWNGLRLELGWAVKSYDTDPGEIQRGLKTVGSCRAYMSPQKRCVWEVVWLDWIKYGGGLKMTCILSHQSHAAIMTLAFL